MANNTLYARQTLASWCTTGSYFVCKSNGFSGCCIVNPCDLDDCPSPGGNSGTIPPPVTVTVTPTSTKTVTQTFKATSRAPSSSFAVDTPRTVGPATTGDVGDVFTQPPSTSTSSKPSKSSTQTLSDIVGSLLTTTTTTPRQGPGANSTPQSSTTQQPSDAASEASSPPQVNSGQIAGAIIGGVLFGLILIVMMFLYLRRRRYMKSVPSLHHEADEHKTDPNSNDQRRSKHSSVHAPFAGKSGSAKQEATGPLNQSPPEIRKSESRSHLGPLPDGYPSGYTVEKPRPAGLNRPTVTTPLIQESDTAEPSGKIENSSEGIAPAQLDSQPCFELDSAPRPLPGPAELPADPSLGYISQISPTSGSNKSLPREHPSPLTPAPLITLNTCAEYPASRSTSDSPTALRADLNATEHEREQKRHATSWANLEL